MDNISVLSPCKINLFLHINHQRPDGYHELQTLFQLLNYGDDMTFSLREDDEIVLTPQLEDVPLTSNLIWKAAQILKKAAQDSQHNATNKPMGANISINKRIPMGGGLGGGSSNAATTLLVLNKLWGINLDLDILAQLGRSLGADVPVFVAGNTAWAEGIGEELHPMEMPQKSFLVIKPNCSVETSKIFSHKRLTRDTPKLKIAPALEGYGSALRNDCEPLVRELFPPVGQAIDWLNNYSSAMLTGTGACVFASFEDIKQANEALTAMPENFEGFVAQGINQSPVYQRLENLT